MNLAHYATGFLHYLCAHAVVLQASLFKYGELLSDENTMVLYPWLLPHSNKNLVFTHHLSAYK